MRTIGGSPINATGPDAGGERTYASSNRTKSIHSRKVHTTESATGYARAVLVFDRFIRLKGGKTDALIVTVRDYTQGEAEITMAAPYRPASDAKGFAVHRPKFLGFKGAEPDWQKVGKALWVGIAKHEKGADVWNKHLDESK